MVTAPLLLCKGRFPPSVSPSHACARGRGRPAGRQSVKVRTQGKTGKHRARTQASVETRAVVGVGRILFRNREKAACARVELQFSPFLNRCRVGYAERWEIRSPRQANALRVVTSPVWTNQPQGGEYPNSPAEQLAAANPGKHVEGHHLAPSASSVPRRAARRARNIIKLSHEGKK